MKLSRSLMLVATLWLAGCSGSPVIQYYMLSAEEPPEHSVHPKYEPHIAVGPVSLPEIVNRPQFVIRTAINQVTVVENHQWADPLADGMSRVIAENLMQLLGVKQISVYPQSAAGHAEYRVLVDMHRFESSLGGTALMDALWTVRHSGSNERKSLKEGRSRSEEPTNGSTYEALAAAHSRNLARISHDIAEAIRSMMAGFRE